VQTSNLAASGERRRREWRAAFVGLLLSGLLGVLVWLRLGPPEVVPSSAPPSVFSAERARAHLERIARAPHPSGSPEARAVEAYLVRSLEELGLVVEVQAAPACVEIAGLRSCGNVRNVLATLGGTSKDAGEGALQLSAHYDSVSNAPGAGDDGAAVAALLETARALAHAGPVEHDVLFAFLDGEEDLLLGSAAFCRAADRRSRVRLVANFDARGSRGAVTLIGATPGSASVVARLADEVAHPVLSSFYPSVASVLPNATDAEMYARCGLETVSFAFAGGFEHYHQSNDGAAELDYRSLQHHGEYALAVARHFAHGGGASSTASADLVFFDIAALTVVAYPAFVAQLLAVALAIATGLLLVRRVRSGRLSLGALLASGAAYGSALLVSVVLGSIVVAVVTWGWRPWAAYVNASGLAACAACFVVAAYVACAGLVRAPARGAEPWLFGPIGVWVGLACLTAALVPGMSQLFTWPAAALLATAASRERAALSARRARVMVAARCALLLPAVLLITPVIYTLVIVVGAPGASGAMACVVLLLGAFAVPVELLVSRARQVSLVFAALGVLLALGLRLQVAIDPGPPTGNTINYALESQARRAFWMTADGRKDDFTAQFLGNDPELGRFEAFRADLPLAAAAAPVVALPAPVLDLISDTWLGGTRRIILRARSRRAARGLKVWETSGVSFDGYSFDGSPPVELVRFSPELDRKLYRLLSGTYDDGRFGVSLFSARPEGSVLSLTTRHEGALELRLFDSSKGLAALPAGFAPRSAEWVEGYPGDHTWVTAPPLSIAPLPRP
jgi:hypothetical protein